MVSCYFFFFKYEVSKIFFFFFSSRRRHTRYWRDWSSDVCSSDLALCSWLQGPIRPLHGSSKPPGGIQPDPCKVGVVRHGTLDEIMIQAVKERLNVQINHPVGGPASFPRSPHGVERRPARSIGVGVRVEPGLHFRLEHHLRDRLCNSVRHRRNAEGTHATVCLRYLDESHWRREVRA